MYPQFLGESAKDPGGLQISGESSSLAIPQGTQENQHRRLQYPQLYSNLQKKKKEGNWLRCDLKALGLSCPTMPTFSPALYTKFLQG